MKKSDILRYEMIDLEHSGLPFRELAMSGDSLRTPFDFILGAPSADLFDMIQTQMQYKSIGYYIANDHYVSYDGNIIGNGSILKSYLMNVSEFNKSILNHFLIDEMSVCNVLDGPCVVLYGFGWNQYGHWLVELLTKIFVISGFGIDLNAVKWIIPNNTPDFALFFIRKLGIVDSQLVKFSHESEVLYCKNLFIVTNVARATYGAHRIFSEYSTWLRKHFVDHKSGIDKNNKIFAHRKKVLNSRPLANESEIIDILISYGYEIYSPEFDSIEEQILKFSTASSIVGAYGSALHNSIFSPEKIIVTALRHSGTDTGLSQSSICAARSQKISYLFGESTESGLHIPEFRLRSALDFANSCIENF